MRFTLGKQFAGGQTFWLF